MLCELLTAAAGLGSAKAAAAANDRTMAFMSRSILGSGAHYSTTQARLQAAAYDGVGASGGSRRIASASRKRIQGAFRRTLKCCGRQVRKSFQSADTAASSSALPA